MRDRRYDAPMDHPILVVFCLLVSYLLGSVLAAYPVQRWYGLVDPGSSGSGNPGATNMYRLGGWQPALLTLIWDVGKGMLAVFFTRWLSDDYSTLLLSAVAAVTGHVLPVFHRFRGGKGVATTMGAMLMVAPATTLVLTALWVFIMKWKRISALASLSAAAAAPWLAWLLDPESVPFFTVLAIFLLVRHRDNIARLVNRQEAPLSHRPERPPEQKVSPGANEESP